MYQHSGGSCQQILNGDKNMSTALILLSEFRKTEIELWRPVEGLSAYDVSNLGRVRSYYKRAGRKGYRVDSTPTDLKISTIWSGYTRATLRDCGKYRYLSLHRLVAQTFLSNPDGLPEVNHINGVKADCRVGNLEWASMSVNKLHATRAGMAGGEKHGMAKLNEDDVREIRRRGADRKSGVAKVLAADYKVTRKLIHLILNKRIWKYVV